MDNTWIPVSKSNRMIDRIGGVALLLGFVIHIVANMVLKTYPDPNLAADDVHSYILEESGNWAIIHGIRYIAIVCIVIFSSVLFTRVASLRSRRLIVWSLVGLLGSVLMMANLLLTNGIEILTFLDFDRISGNDELFWLLFNLTRVLFTAEIITWSLMIFGFSTAGKISGTLPLGLIILGWISAASCLLSAAFIYPVLQGGWASIAIEIGSISGLLWFISTGVYLLIVK